MDARDAIEFAGENHRAVMMTYRPSGGIQSSPITVGAEGDRLVVSSRETAFKVKNLERDPRVTLCMFTDRFFGPWIQVDGKAKVVRLPEAMERLVEYYRNISGEHPDWDEYRQAMEEQKRVIIEIEVERVGPTKEG